MFDIIIAAYSYIAALIGAGFASGQEILCYFVKYGKSGLLGILLSAMIFSIFSFFTMLAAQNNRTYDLDSFLALFRTQRISLLIKLCIRIFSFAVFSVMLAASGSLCHTLFGISSQTAALLTAAAISFILICGADNAFRFNGIIGILLVIGLVSCCLYMLCYREYHTSSQVIFSVSDSVIYSGYNLIPVVPVLISLSKRLKSKRDIAAVSVISFSTLSIVMFLIFALLSIYTGKINLGEIPMLTLAFRQSHFFAIIYGITLLGSVFTTLISSGGSMCENLRKKSSVILLIGTAYFISGFGFGTLINTLYRTCGIVGTMLLIMLIVKIISGIKK